MLYRRLGKSCAKISVLGLGFWQIGSRMWSFRVESLDKTTMKLVEKAYGYGINFYDTAEIYGGGWSEKYLGLAIRSLGIREEVVVASKVAGYRTTRGSIVKSVKRIIDRLGFKPDLIQHHWPPPVYGSICRVVNALEEVVDTGLSYMYGLSNYGRRELEEALQCVKKTEPVSNQVQYSLGYRTAENTLKPYMDQHGLTLIAWSPLAKGSLAGLREPRTRAQRGDPVFKAVSSDRDLLEALNRISLKHGASMSAIALAWLIEKGAVPIPGTRTPSRIDEYVKAVEIKLDSDDLSLLDSVSRKYLVKWGREYNALGSLKYVPGFIQSLAISLIGGI